MTSAEVGHDALVNLSREEAFQAADDVAFGPASGAASGDVVAGRLVELHPDDDGSIEGRVGVSVAASIEAVPTGGHPRRGRDRQRMMSRLVRSGAASGDVVAGRLVELHPDDDGSIEGRVGVSVAASIEAVPTGGHPRRGRDRAGAAELREGGLRTNPVGVIAEDDQQLSRGVGAHTEALAEGR